MKTFILLLLITVAGTHHAFSQQWRDSLDHARELYKKGRYQEALKYYKSADRLAPNDVNLSEETGQSAYKAGDYQAAEEAYREAANRRTDNNKKVSAYKNLGSSQMRQKDYAGAEESYKEALRLDPSNERARQLLAEARRLKKEQEQKQQQQNRQQQNQGNQDDQQDQRSDQQRNDRQKQQPSDEQNRNNQQQQQQQQQSGQQQRQERSSSGQKLADKQTERKLDELMRQEMDAKRRLDGSKENVNGKKAKKDW